MKKKIEIALIFLVGVAMCMVIIAMMWLYLTKEDPPRGVENETETEVFEETEEDPWGEMGLPGAGEVIVDGGFVIPEGDEEESVEEDEVLPE